MHPMNAALPATSFVANHLTCPLWIRSLSRFPEAFAARSERLGHAAEDGGSSDAHAATIQLRQLFTPLVRQRKPLGRPLGPAMAA